ncbi:hypothetical protein L1I79_35450 [Strepomyces sp. STD 3.1]|nr:hypothetical protein [Streptomyces sp. STD 3.1]
MAEAIGHQVTVPDSRGAAPLPVAAARQAAEVNAGAHDAYAPGNRAGELGMKRATKRPHRHVPGLLTEVTAPLAPRM